MRIGERVGCGIFVSGQVVRVDHCPYPANHWKVKSAYVWVSSTAEVPDGESGGSGGVMVVMACAVGVYGVDEPT